MFISAILALTLAGASDVPEVECYDAKIKAKPTAQIPIVYANDDPDTIVISWPWFVDLKVLKVLEGNIQEYKVATLAVLHTNYISKARIWLLRRNTAGFYNIIRAEPTSVPRCGRDSPPAQPYLRLADGETYENYRREGEEQLERYSDDE